MKIIKKLKPNNIGNNELSSTNEKQYQEEIKTCKNCKYFQRYDFKDYLQDKYNITTNEVPFGECMNIQLNSDNLYHDLIIDFQSIDNFDEIDEIEEYDNNIKKISKDLLTTYDLINVGEDFGCIHFSKKEKHNAKVN